MQTSFVRAAGVAVLVFIALPPPPPLPAQAAVEAPPAFNAAKIPGITRVGRNYTVETPVRSDGLLRVYVLATPYGKFTARGDAMMRMRANELNALALLERVSNSDAFAQALAKAGLSPLKYTGQLITNPLGTIENTLGGVDAMFKRFHAGMANVGRTRDNELEGLLGVTDERRLLASAYGVDPYTDFPPLDAKLTQLSQAAAAGGLVVTGALMAVPGTAGLVVSNLATANRINDVGLEQLARDYTAAQLLELNRGVLAKMGVDQTLAGHLLANRNYTPIDLTAMIAALDSMPQVQGREVFVERAAAASERYVAYFNRIQAEQMAADYRRHRGYVRFVMLGGFPFLATTDGRVVTLAPIDALAWTKANVPRLTSAFADRKRMGFKGRGEIRISGQATALAQRQIKEQGWIVVERQQP